MSKERRLGRGLEALLGQLPMRKEPPSAVAPIQQQEVTSQALTAPPAGQAESASATPTSDDPLFWLDAAHAAPGEFMAQPHHPTTVQPQPTPIQAAPAVEEGTSKTSVQRVGVRLIDHNPAQPRQEFDPREMQSLSESIAAHGLLQPVVVRRVADRYQLIAGERRLRAAIQAGWTDVPVNVVEADDRQVAELAIVENLQRKDLNALEKAASFQKYIEQYKCTQEELAGRLKLDRSTVANMIRLLELPESVQGCLRRGEITQGHARALLPLGDEREQVEFCQRIRKEGLNVRQTERMVQELIDAADHEPLADLPAPPKSRRTPHAKNEHLTSLEQKFRAALGMKVKITHNARGRGRLVVQFRDHEEFERLKKHICGE